MEDKNEYGVYRKARKGVNKGEGCEHYNVLSGTSVGKFSRCDGTLS